MLARERRFDQCRQLALAEPVELDENGNRCLAVVPRPSSQGETQCRSQRRLPGAGSAGDDQRRPEVSEQSKQLLVAENVDVARLGASVSERGLPRHRQRDDRRTGEADGDTTTPSSASGYPKSSASQRT
jgi:hypothetical protein